MWSPIRLGTCSWASERCYEPREATDVFLREERSDERSDEGTTRNVPFTLTHRLQHPWSQVDEPRSDQGAVNARFDRREGIVHQPV